MPDTLAPEQLAACMRVALKAKKVLADVRDGTHHSDIREASKIIFGIYDQDLIAALLAAPAALLSHFEAQAWRPISEAVEALHRPVIIGKRGSPLMAFAVYLGQHWRHAEGLTEVCFEPDVFQPLPPAPAKDPVP